MRPLTFLIALIVLGLLPSCAWLPPAGAPAMPTMTPPPASCRAACPIPPPRQNPRLEWERQIEDWAWDCRARTQACAAWANRQAPEPTKDTP